MSMTAWDDVNKRFIKVQADEDGILKTKPEGVYLSAPDNLVEGQQQRLRLTIDGKLMVDDPTTQAAVAAVEVKVDDVEAKLDVPANYMADVSALALEATVEAVAVALEGHHLDIEALLEDAMQKATGPAWNQDTDSLEAIRERCDTIHARLA